MTMFYYNWGEGGVDPKGGGGGGVDPKGGRVSFRP